jgi:hypothetical protein
VQVHGYFKGKHCLQLEIQGVCETSKKMVTATRTSNPKSCFPVWKNNSNGATRPHIISVSFFTSTINGVSVQIVFLRVDNIQSFTIKQMRSVNLKAVISKFKITFHIFQELACIQTQRRYFLSISYGLKTPIIWKSTYCCTGCNAL